MLDTHTILVFYGNVLRVTLLMGALNTGGVGKNHDSRPISGFIVYRQKTLQLPSVIHTAAMDRG